MDMKKTGELIAEARRAKGLTQAQLAEQLHVNHTTISKWERGQGFPDVSLLEPLATALGLTLTEIFRGEAGAPAPETETIAEQAVQAAGEEMRRAKKQLRLAIGAMAAILLSLALWIVGSTLWKSYIAPFDLDIRGAYQSTQIPVGDYGMRWESGYCIQLSAQNWQEEQDFWLYINSELADYGVWKKQKANLYLMEGLHGTYTVELHRDGSFYLALPGQEGYITMEKIFDIPIVPLTDAAISEKTNDLRKDIFGQ